MNKRVLFYYLCLLGGIVILTISACKKESSCYDESLYQQHKDDLCTTDCSGVIGCDGKTYCNECEALRQGIPLK